MTRGYPENTYDYEEVKFLDMSVGDAMKLIISGGAVAPEWKKQQE